MESWWKVLKHFFMKLQLSFTNQTLPIKESINRNKFSHIVKLCRSPYANLSLWFMKYNISENQTKYILLDVSNTHSWYLRPIGLRGVSTYLCSFMDTGRAYAHKSLNESLLIIQNGYLLYFYTLCVVGVTHDLPQLGVHAKYASNSHRA